MKNLFAIILCVAALAASAVAQPTQGSVSTRLANLEAPLLQPFASNSTTVQLDFRNGAYQDTNGISAGEQDYAVINLNGNLTIQLTNLVAGVERRVFINTDGTARTIAISTNGLTSQTRISYNLNIVTNGSYALSVTNRARVTLLNRPPGEVQVGFAWYQ